MSTVLHRKPSNEHIVYQTQQGKYISNRRSYDKTITLSLGRWNMQKCETSKKFHLESTV